MHNMKDNAYFMKDNAFLCINLDLQISSPSYCLYSLRFCKLENVWQIKKDLLLWNFLREMT